MGSPFEKRGYCKCRVVAYSDNLPREGNVHNNPKNVRTTSPATTTHWTSAPAKIPMGQLPLGKLPPWTTIPLSTTNKDNQPLGQLLLYDGDPLGN